MKLEKEGLVVTPLTEQKTGLWDMAFIWFCANVAVPRLMIGGSLAELGFGKMILTLLVGNIVVFGNVSAQIVRNLPRAGRIQMFVRIKAVRRIIRDLIHADEVDIIHVVFLGDIVNRVGVHLLFL